MESMKPMKFFFMPFMPSMVMVWILDFGLLSGFGDSEF